LFQVPQSLAKVASVYSYILTDEIKSIKKKWKSSDMTVQNFHDFLEDFKRQRKEI